jgi:hypothetical protein
MTRRVFPGWEPTLKLEHDPELPESYIVFGVRTAQTEVPQLMKAHRAWMAGLREICPGLAWHWFVYRMESAQ